MTPAIPTRALLTPSGRPSTITPPPCSSSLLPSLLYASSPLTPLSAPRAPVAPYTLPSPPPLCRPPHDTTSRSAPCAGRDHATAPAPTTAAAAVAAASDYAHYPRLSPEDVAPPTPPPYHAAAALLGQSLRLLPRRRRRTRLQESSLLDQLLFGTPHSSCCVLVHNTVPPPTPQPDRPVKHPLCRCNPQSSQIDGQIRCTGQKNGLLSCRPSWQLNQYCLQVKDIYIAEKIFGLSLLKYPLTALRKDMAICESSIDIIKGYGRDIHKVQNT
ncbi:hypothetical protein OsI_18952 [Oryza sativa Indica Group]|uniref:Uncharacterized protein n=1 Tax=Oryza sativa subsp. indica TaxID=39946 RepID=B8AZD4_ORYSI|nr:hypothetical protein OsI_18952 [Oryza sativa Indica Group]